MIRGRCSRIAMLLFGLAILSTFVQPLSAQAVRRNVRSAEAERMLASYGRAIEVMRRLPADDPHSWSFQANLHGFPAGTPNPSPLWAQCQHGQWWFLPWHRAYLSAFENIIRVHSGDPTFALPYWDWSEPEARTLPAAFRNANSPLFDASRRPGVNNGSEALEDTIVVTDVNRALSRPAFFTNTADNAADTFGGIRVAQPTHFGPAAGAIELSPHNTIHGWIGGNMGDPDTAARDPIFYLHHANIDRLWEVWLASAGRQNPTDEPVWMNQGFTLFDENKRPFTIAVRDMLNTRTQLNYAYADPRVARKTPGKDRIQPGKSALPARANSRTAILLEPQTPWGELRRDPMQIMLRFDAQLAVPIQRLALKSKLSKGELMLVVEGINYEARVADSPLVVCLNAPGNARMSSLKCPHFADMHAFYGPVRNQTARFRLGEKFEQQRTQPGFRPESLTVTLSRYWFGKEAPANPATVTFKKISLVVEQ